MIIIKLVIYPCFELRKNTPMYYKKKTLKTNFILFYLMKSNNNMIKVLPTIERFGL